MLIKHSRKIFHLLKKKPVKLKCTVLSLSFIEFIRDKIPFFDKPEDKIAKYWEQQSTQQAIEKADKLFEEEQYMEVYESLNRIKYSKDIEVIWRIAKALYNLSLTEEIAPEVRKEMIDEAYDILKTTSFIGDGKANYHKWMAIILNTKNGMESLETKIEQYPVVRRHLMAACETNPRDFTIQYMLGKWYYEMASLTWFQRKIAKYIYVDPPTATLQEAYKHLIKAEELQPRSFRPNLYLLGCICMKLRQYYRAKYFLHMALSLPTNRDCDKCCTSSAKSLLAKLEKYDLGRDLLYDHYPWI